MHYIIFIIFDIVIHSLIWTRHTLYHVQLIWAGGLISMFILNFLKLKKPNLTLLHIIYPLQSSDFLRNTIGLPGLDKISYMNAVLLMTYCFRSTSCRLYKCWWSFSIVTPPEYSRTSFRRGITIQKTHVSLG